MSSPSDSSGGCQRARAMPFGPVESTFPVAASICPARCGGDVALSRVAGKGLGWGLVFLPMTRDTQAEGDGECRAAGGCGKEHRVGCLLKNPAPDQWGQQG